MSQLQLLSLITNKYKDSRTLHKEYCKKYMKISIGSIQCNLRRLAKHKLVITKTNKRTQPRLYRRIKWT